MGSFLVIIGLAGLVAAAITFTSFKGMGASSVSIRIFCSSILGTSTGSDFVTTGYSSTMGVGLIGVGSTGVATVTTGSTEGSGAGAAAARTG